VRTSSFSGADEKHMKTFEANHRGHIDYDENGNIEHVLEFKNHLLHIFISDLKLKISWEEKVKK